MTQSTGLGGAAGGLMLTLALFACNSNPTTETPHPEPSGEVEPSAESKRVTIYSGRSESLMALVFDRIGNELELELDVQYGKTAEIVTRLATEGDQSPADVVLAQEVGHLDVLAKRDMLVKIGEGGSAAVDPRFRDPKGLWVGTSGRLRVVVVDSKNVPVSERPASLADLADPKWKGRLGWAPTNGSMQSHVGALCSLWGEEKTAKWLADVKANEPRRYPKNSPQVAAADASEIAIGWVNHYYLHRKSDAANAVNHSFPTKGDAGNILMIAGAGVVKTSDVPDAAQRVVAALTSETSQTYFAQEVFEYPVRPGVKTHDKVPALDTISLADVDPTALTDLKCARKLLDDADLL